MKVFCILSVFAIVQMIIFAQYNGLDYLGDKISFYSKYSFGNMGFSGSICAKTVINWEDVNNSLLIL